MTSYSTSNQTPALHEAGNSREPLISIRDLKVYFDLGADPGDRKYLMSLVVKLVCLVLGGVGGFYLVKTVAGLTGVGPGLLSIIIRVAGAIVGAIVAYVVGRQIARTLIGSAARRAVRAVDGVTLNIYPGETLGLVGESGCGKSTLGRAILRLTQPTSGQVFFRGQDLAHLSNAYMRSQRRYLQIIFQDPYASLNPRMTVSQIIGEPIETFRLARGSEKKRRVQDLMETVGLSARFLKRYPHEFSGGQRQRIGIARALAVQPDFIVADEPISALDVSIQAQIMNLLDDLQAEFNLTYLFIAHDIAVVRHISDRVAVMYLGKIVDLADRNELYEKALHPYTKALLSAVPIPDPVAESTRERIILQGDVPSPINPPSGCHFRTRCPIAIPACAEIDPPLEEKARGHWAACIRV